MGVKFPISVKNYKVPSFCGGFARSEKVDKDNSVINSKESSSIDKELQIIFEKTIMNLLMSNYQLQLQEKRLFVFCFCFRAPRHLAAHFWNYIT